MPKAKNIERTTEKPSSNPWEIPVQKDDPDFVVSGIKMPASDIAFLELLVEEKNADKGFIISHLLKGYARAVPAFADKVREKIDARKAAVISERRKSEGEPEHKQPIPLAATGTGGR